nr:immunoglobulin heavy chain junction region [Mus musculus]MBK4198407.1 immunoglobulin heavy chain junction region [Mus musculus]
CANYYYGSTYWYFGVW